MLLSEIEERARHFKLALRAGIPLLILIALVLYAIFFQGEDVVLTLMNKVLLIAIVFITIYFIYFLIEISTKETLIDQTTQGFNQKAFIEKLEDHHPNTLVLLIIDNLSTLNENYSLEQIDILLYTIIHKINLKFKQYNTDKAFIGRLYGAEFVVALEDDHKQIQDIMKEFIKENRTINDIEIDYKFGIVTETTHDFEKAILQLKNIIQAQENECSKEFSEYIIKDAHEISQVETDILHALKEELFELSFRPLQNTKSMHNDIYEVSVKLKSSTTKDILPRVFLPIINRLGLGREYDFILFKRIVSLVPLLDDDVSFTFNLSPFSLRDKEFQINFFSHLEYSGVNPARLIVELYERKTHHNLSGYLKTLNKFRVKGIRIAIDNFGSSNASMEYMKHFKFDLVQFDRDYVVNLEDTNTHAMLNSLVQMSKELDIITVAKWVDKESQKEKLKAIGLDYLQGFGIAKPISERELIENYN